MSARIDRHFSSEDLDRIEKSVAQTERHSDGEIAIVLASHSRHWLLDPLLLASMVGIGGLAATLLFTRNHDWGVYYDYTQAALVGLAGFVLTFVVLGLPRLRSALARRAVRRNALRSFGRLQPTRARTGVLIFVSMAEREAAVVADVAVAEKLAVDYWNKPYRTIMRGIQDNRYAEGLIEAIGEIGSQLTSYFPRSPDDENELPNRPVIT
jgi:putative membrane protein